MKAASRIHALAESHRRQKARVELILAFEFFDGPESAVALFDNGEAILVHAFGESRTRRFRAFKVRRLQGAWSQRLREFDKGSSQARVLIVGDTDPDAGRLRREITDAVIGDPYVAIGSAYLERLWIRETTQDWLERVFQIDHYTDAFREALHFVSCQK